MDSWSRDHAILISDWSKVGGDMSEAEAIAHIKAADADGNMAIDFAEFGKLWEALHGAEEVGRAVN